MKTTKVNNNFNFFLFRYFSTIFLCYLTLFITGRIADMAFLLGDLEYDAGGTSTEIAKNIFTSLSFLNNKYFIIAIITALCSITLFFILNNFIDKINLKLWSFFLFSPGLLIYTNTPTKETLFLYPAIIYIILEIYYLLDNRSQINLVPLISKIGLIFLMFITRGDLALPYLGLFFLSIIFKTFYIGELSNKINLNKLIINSFLIYIFIIYMISIIFPDFLIRNIEYLNFSFQTNINFYRPIIDFQYMKNPLNSLQLQYLALFPTPMELITKPHQILIVFDSIILIYVFLNSWRKLFKLTSSSRIFKKISLIIFIYISVLYFSVFGIIGSFNLGSSQRLRINFFPIGIFFPLILEKKIRDKRKQKFPNHKEIY